MSEHTTVKSAIWNRAAQNIDALVVACVSAVAGAGLLAFSQLTPAPAPASVEKTAFASLSDETRTPALRKQRQTGNAAEYHPWEAPRPYTPTLPERDFADPPPQKGGPALLTRFETPQEDPNFHPSHYDVKNTHYSCHWRAENVESTSSGALLAVHRQAGGHGKIQPCTAAELQTPAAYGYGRYEAVMRPSRGSGLVSAFFTYTGAYFGDPHDEIDIEFLGKDTTKVHFNYFRRGKTHKPAIFDLPFDAADADRLYAFEWTPNRITWFVEGVPFYTVEDTEGHLPVTPGKIYASNWAGHASIEGWTGPRTYKSGSGAHFSCISFVPMGQTGPSCADDYKPPVVLSP